MKKHLIIAAILASSSLAHAGGTPHSWGVGIERSINNETGGLSVNYDNGNFHVGGFFDFHDAPGGNNEVYSFGARFFYHVHSTAMSDFGLGGGIGVGSHPHMPEPNDTSERHTDMFVEPSAQIRLFLASNVALSFTAGIVIGVLDADGIAISGQGGGDSTAGSMFPVGIAGVHYYF